MGDLFGPDLNPTEGPGPSDADQEAARRRLESMGWERVPLPGGGCWWLAKGGGVKTDDQALAWLARREGERP